jgi:hypothetical protein
VASLLFLCSIMYSLVIWRSLISCKSFIASSDKKIINGELILTLNAPRCQMHFLSIHLHVEIEEILNQDTSLSAGWVANQLALKCNHWLLNRVRSIGVIVRLDALTSLLMKVQIFVDVTCSLANIFWRFGAAYYLQNVSNFTNFHGILFLVVFLSLLSVCITA